MTNGAFLKASTGLVRIALMNMNQNQILCRCDEVVEVSDIKKRA